MLHMDLEILSEYALRLSRNAELLRENAMRNKMILNEIYDDERIAMFDKSIEVKEQLEETISNLEKNAERMENLSITLKNSIVELGDILKSQGSEMKDLLSHMSSVVSNVNASAVTSISEVENFISNNSTETVKTITDDKKEKLDYINIASVSDGVKKSFEVTNVKTM